MSFTVTPFAAECREYAGNAWGASFEHPFVQALVDGSLDSEKFKFYQMQDARYLEAFADTASLISTRRPDVSEKLWFIDAAKLALVVEGELHAGYGEKLGYNATDIANIELTPNNRAYSNHMLEMATRGSVVEAIAALTPCPWLYIDLGAYNLKKLNNTIPETHPYHDWLQTYASEDFFDYMQVLLGYLQKAADEADSTARLRAKEAFKISARYEYMFWQQAWEFQSWPV